FASLEQMDDACVKCHEAELKRGHDSHPKSKFTDPRNADRIEILDARSCVTCHTEHQPEQTTAMGLTVPKDYCIRCHADVANERPTHKGLGFGTCADAGCHNFHDNTALYEDFLLEHATDPGRPQRASVPRPTPTPTRATPTPDAPAGALLPDDDLAAWRASPHASDEVNCSSCHGDGASGFSEEVPHSR